jgi:hypothetical protein
MFHLSLIPDFNNFLYQDNDETHIDNKYLKIITKTNRTYKILQYNKELLAFDLVNSYGLLRSVIVNDKNNVVCFSPPKSMNADKFIEKYPRTTTITKTLVAEEFIEGTMINVFYDKDYNKWKIATKSKVDADVKFYSSTNKTFANMFIEACYKNNLVIQTLNPAYCYSFVLQHPENRIVVPINQCQLYLVEIYSIEKETNGNINVITENIEKIKDYGYFNNSFIKFPQKYDFTSYQELIDNYASPNTPYYVLGVIIKNKETGERTKIRNPIYEEVKQLRGNQSKLQFQYITLRQQGKVNEFLKFYPEYRSVLSSYRDQIHFFTNTLFQNYISCYIHKKKPLKEFSPQYKTHMFKLHEKYINELKPQNMFVSNTVVIEYVNQLPPPLLMYSLNYNLRKHNIDVITQT